MCENGGREAPVAAVLAFLSLSDRDLPLLCAESIRDAMATFRKRHATEYAELLQRFETEKMAVDAVEKKDRRFELPAVFADHVRAATGNSVDLLVQKYTTQQMAEGRQPELGFIRGKLKLSYCLFEALFSPFINKIIAHLKSESMKVWCLFASFPFLLFV